MTCKFCDEDLSYVKYNWKNPQSKTGEIIEIHGKCTKCDQKYKEKYEYLGYEVVEA